jgi:hypothetical protein
VQETPSSPVSATAAANTQVQITIPGVAGQTIRINHLSFSYSGAAAAGGVTIVVNAVTIWQIDVAGADFQLPPLPPGGLLCQAGQNAVVTLAAGGAGVTGKLNVASYMGP